MGNFLSSIPDLSHWGVLNDIQKLIFKLMAEGIIFLQIIIL